MRASDADRDVAAEVLNAAFGDGRLDSAEHAERMTTALGSKRLGELVPILADIVVSSRRGQRPRTPARTGRLLQDGALRSWLGLALLFNVIWVATWLFAGQAPYYYWPIWPMIGTAVPALVLWVSGGSMANRSRPDDRDRRRLDRGR